jgi:hypothetical protein
MADVTINVTSSPLFNAARCVMQPVINIVAMEGTQH